MRSFKKLFGLLLTSALLVQSVSATMVNEDIVADDALQAYRNNNYVVIQQIEPQNYVGFGPNYPGSTKRFPECTTGQLLKGTIIASCDSQGNHCWKNYLTSNASCAFDGDMTTQFDPYEASANSWAGLILDQAYELTEIRVAVREKYPTRLNGSAIQGSNDGENWVTIMYFDQDAVSADYHIITSEPVSDEYAAAGCPDYSRYWVGSGSYKMFRFVSLATEDITKTGRVHGEAVELELYGNPAPATEVAPQNTLEKYNGTINYSGKYAIVADESGAGEIISGGVSYEGVAAAFDNDMTTAVSFDANVGDEVNYWMGLYFEEAIVPLQFRLAVATEEQRKNVLGTFIQASKDSVNWTTLTNYYTGVPKECYESPEDGGIWNVGDYKIIPMNTTEAYNYFRCFNYNRMGLNELSEFQVVDAASDVNTLYRYVGDIVYTGVRVTAPMGSLVGEIIGAGAEKKELVKAFDGNLDTTAVLPANVGDDVSNWLGIKFPAAVFPFDFFVAVTPHTSIYNSRFQGSNDGVIWEDIEILNLPEDCETWDEIPGYKQVSVVSEQTYTYYRYFNYNDRGENKLDEFLVFGDMDPVDEPDYTTGDINGDGLVEIADALLLFQHSLMPDVYPITYPGNVDFNYDDTLDISDALRLFQYSLMPDVYPIA